LLIVVLAGVAPAFAKRTQDVQVQINKAVTSNGLKIEFVELVEDSRCPTDAQCVWAGNAKIKVLASKPGHKTKTVLLNTGIEPQSVIFAGYQIRLTGLTPEPRTNIRIRRDGYVATFSIAKVHK